MLQHFMFSLVFSMKLFAKKTFYASTNFNQHENVMHSIDKRPPPFPHSSAHTFTNKLTRVNPPNKFERKRDQKYPKSFVNNTKTCKEFVKTDKVGPDRQHRCRILWWAFYAAPLDVNDDFDPFWQTWTIIIDVLLALRGLTFFLE